MTALPATFGKYFLTSKLATGGMAEIFLAKLIGPSGFEKRLVIKKIHPQFSSEHQFVDLFVAEAKVLVSLSHGNIVPIYELGVVQEVYFIAMEYIDGPTLERLGRTVRRRGEKLSPPTATYIAAEILKGLDYAHRKGDGIIHRDLSSRNVMLSREGEVKLVDFGLAVHSEGRQLSRGAGGRPAGSFPYMSPEQVRGDQLDPRSDLFSAGVLLWEMLAGRSLFARPDPDETLKAVCEAEILQPSIRNPEVGEELDEICARALQRDRADRYQTAAEFLRPLSRYLYTADAAVGPSDLSSLLASTCPPSNRELVAGRPEGAESEPPADDDDDGNGSDHLGGTVVMSGRSRPQGKRTRAETAKTFATNALWKEELREAAVPLDETESHVKVVATEPEPIESGAADAAPSWTRLLAIAAALVIGALGAFLWIRASGGAPGADALEPDAGVIVTTVGPADAGNPAVAAVDAAITASVADAAPKRRRLDAGPTIVRRKPDAGRITDPTPVASATLVVGAVPWADVTVDGRKVGRAPGRFKVSAGKHAIVATFKGQTRRWTVNIGEGGSKSLFVEFDPPAP